MFKVIYSNSNGKKKTVASNYETLEGAKKFASIKMAILSEWHGNENLLTAEANDGGTVTIKKNY